METLVQDYSKYTEQDFWIWRTLFERQEKNLQDKACKEYLECLEELKPVLNADEIPHFDNLSAFLKERTGWTIKVVPGLIPIDEFVQLLADKVFCSSTWLRKPEELDYLEEPDMFHDIFGHVPLLLNKDYSDFSQKMGEIGTENKDNEKILKELQRFYWFTIEFGLMNSPEKHLIYGTGILSSYGESNFIYEKPITILPFDLDVMTQTDFITSEIQERYFIVDSFNQVYDALSIYQEELLSGKRQ